MIAGSNCPLRSLLPSENLLGKDVLEVAGHERYGNLELKGRTKDGR
jgi:hypothetical protein